MGQGASSSRTQTAQTSNTAIKQLNESLFELHKPRGQPSMVILFFHGFQHGNYDNAHFSTWKCGDGLWPQTWLVDDDGYPNAHILSVAYNASLMKSKESGSFDLYIIGENIISDLLQANIGQEASSPIVFVAHSFGGLVVKELCVQAHKRGSMGSSKHKNLLENIKGVFFYATPHHGVSNETAEYFVSKTNQPLLEYVKILSTYAARLHEDFERLQKQCTWRTAGVGEGLPTSLSTSNTKLIVPEASSRYGEPFVIVPKADHISICRPPSKISTTFNSLSSFLQGVTSTWKRPGRPQNHQYLPKSRIGMNVVMEQLKQKLETVTSLGLTGMGGIGKATMAKALFNDMEHLYEYTCFIGDVKNIEGDVEDIVLHHMHHMGKNLAMKECGLQGLDGKQLLLVLDDVATEKDIAIVLVLIDHICVHTDSRFVVTSRDSKLLENYLHEVHPMAFLSPEFAKELLVAHAFRQEVSPSFETYIDIVVRKCGGLALTLEVIGKHLHKKPLAIWKEAITILDRAENVCGLDEKLWSKLRLGYDSLELEEKHMFLDCATLFYGQSLEKAKVAWSITTNGLQETSWQHLLELSLVWEVDDGFGLHCGMHEQLLSLGKKIASNEAANGRRIWDDYGPRKAFILLTAKNCTEEDVKDIVAINVAGRFQPWYDRGAKNDIRDSTTLENSTAENVTKVFHTYVRCDECSISPIEGPRFMSRVKFNYDLCLSCFEKGGHREDEYFRLNLPSDFPWIEGSTWCKMRNLRYLKMSNGGIDKSHVLTLPPTLVLLEMVGMKFSDFPFRPGDHRRMAILRIKECCGLCTLPGTFGLLSSLQHLEIGGAPYLESLPESLGNLPKLTHLVLYDCPSLVELPRTFGKLETLENLVIADCDALSALPKSFGNLAKLKYLLIQGCRSLDKLPDTFLDHQRLQNLILVKTCLQSIPELENLRSLTFLYIDQEVPNIYVDGLSDWLEHRGVITDEIMATRTMQCVTDRLVDRRIATLTMQERAVFRALIRVDSLEHLDKFSRNLNLGMAPNNFHI